MNIKINIPTNSVEEAMQVIGMIDTEGMRKSHPDLNISIEVAQGLSSNRIMPTSIGGYSIEEIIKRNPH